MTFCQDVGILNYGHGAQSSRRIDIGFGLEIRYGIRERGPEHLFQEFNISRFQDFKSSRFQDFKSSRVQEFKIMTSRSLSDPYSIFSMDSLGAEQG